MMHVSQSMVIDSEFCACGSGESGKLMASTVITAYDIVIRPLVSSEWLFGDFDHLTDEGFPTIGPRQVGEGELAVLLIFDFGGYAFTKGLVGLKNVDDGFLGLGREFLELEERHKPIRRSRLQPFRTLKGKLNNGVKKGGNAHGIYGNA